MHSYITWFVFTLVFGLVPFAVVWILSWCVKKPRSCFELFRDGSLLYFASAIVFGSFGEYLICDVRHKQGFPELVDLLAIGFLVLLTIFVFGAYGLIVSESVRNRANKITLASLVTFSELLTLGAGAYAFLLTAVRMGVLQL